jgi:hypothetical protein
VVGAVALTLLLVSGSGHGAPLVTPAQAQQVIGRLWNAREHALDTRDLAAFNRIETGSARRTDVQAAEEVACGCGHFYWTQGPRRFRRALIYLPRQYRYPLYFGAAVLADQPHAPATNWAKTYAMTAWLIVTRRAPTQPWRISVQMFDNGYNDPTYGFPAPGIGLDRQGYDNLGRSAPPVGATRTWFPKLIAYYNQIKKTGQQPWDSPFAPGPLTSQSGLEQPVNGDRGDGTTATYIFKPGRYGGPWVFNASGQTSVCGDIVEDVTATSLLPERLFVQRRNRHEWGPDLPPGLYRSLTTIYEWPICISQDISGGVQAASGPKLDVGGNLGGGYPIFTYGHRIARLPAPRA